MRVLKREQIELPTELTQDEFNLRARELADANHELVTERESQKEAKGAMKLRLEKLEQKRTDLARIVRARTEPRLVDVEHHADYTHGVVEFYRMDTGTKYGHRPLSADDRQLKLMEAPPASETPLAGTVTFKHPDTGETVTMTLEEIEKQPKKFQRAVDAALSAPASTKH